MGTDVLKPAIWEGPFPAQVTDRHSGLQTVLAIGDEYQVTAADLQSTHWRAKDVAKPKRAANEPSAGGGDS